MITYAIIGILFAILIELVRIKLKDLGMYPFSNEADPLGTTTIRILMILFWPLGIMWFGLGFIKTYFKK